MTTSGPSFGRRRAAPIAASLSEANKDSERDRLYRSIANSLQRPATDDVALKVSNSRGAGVLTGAVVGVFHLALHLQDNAAAGLRLGPLVLDLGPSNLPLTLGSTLWAGGRAGFFAAFVVHGILRRLGRSAFADYAVGGALVGIVSALLFQMLGLSVDGWVIEAALGAASGVLYRLFAGAVPAF